MRRAALALVALALGLAAGLFEDQVDKNDWIKQQVGRVTHSLFYSTGPQRLALVATDLSVVAGIDLRSGTIAWRQLLPAGEAISVFQQHGKTLLSLGLAENGVFLRLWSVQGSLLWDAFMPGAHDPAAAGPSAAFAGSAVVISWGAVTTAYHASTGSQLWTHTLASGGQIAVQTTSTSEVGLVGASATSSGKTQLFATQLKLESGEEINSDVLGDVPSGVSFPMVVTLDKKFAVGIDSAGSKMVVHPLGGKAVHSVDLTPLKLEGAAVVKPMSLPSHVACSLSGGGSAVLKLSGGEGRAAPTVTVSKVAAGGTSHSLAHASSREGKTVLMVVTAASGGNALGVEALHVEADGTHGEWAAEENLPWDSTLNGGTAAVWLNSFSRKDGSLGHRFLVSAEDHSLQLLAKEGKAWLREEALATVEAADFLPLPSPIADAAVTERPSFAFALPALMPGLMRRLTDAKAGPGSATATGPAPLYADAYGTRQVMLVRTATSKMFGIHSSDGSVIWSHFVPPVSPGAAVPSIHSTFVSGHGTSHRLIVVAQDSSGYRVRALNPFTGKLIEETSTDGTVLHAAQLPFETAAGSLPLMIVDSSLRVSIFPKGEEATALLAEHVSEVFFYLLDDKAGRLSGYGVAKSAEGFVAAPRWSMVLATGGGTVRMASFPWDAAVHSPVRTLGDRSVLYKYINRNAIALGVTHPPTDDVDGSIEVILVDAASGRVLHTAKHADCEGPVNLLLGENWLIYQYWSSKPMQHHISISEFYTNSSFSDDLLSLILSGPIDYTQRANMFDSFSPAASELYTLSQSYAFGAAVSAMGLSHTAMGITPKNILVATAAGQLAIFDKRLLDPRRPMVAGPNKMSTADREEGLVPYMPSLGGINPLTVLSHRHSIARARTVVSAPTTLESTSLVAVFGLDIFLSRVAPAKEFDRLNEDFNFVALVGATVFLTVATIGSGWFSNRKELAYAWR